MTDRLQGYDYSEQKIITNKKLVIDLNSNSVGTISTTGSGSVTVENSSNKEVSFSADTTVFHTDTIITAQWSYSGGSSGGGGGSSGGGGGGSSSASYAITVDKATGGTVKVSPTRADKGDDTVTITVNPNSG